MKENLVIIQEEDKNESDEGEEISRLDKLMIHPENKKLYYFNLCMNVIVIMDLFYTIQM